MHKTKFYELLEATRKLEEAADFLFDEYRALWVSILGERIEGDCNSNNMNAPYGGCYVSSINETTIEYEGHEYWSYGGHEHHTFELPSRYLYEVWKDEVTAELKQKLDMYNSQKKSREDSQREQELATLERLKNKYESNSQ
jgi:hypothetical protein